MAQDETIKFGKSFRDAGGTLHTNEGVWTRAPAPDRASLSPLPPLTGSGYGGWGLDAGRPRGTGGPSPFAREKGWRTVFGEELESVNNGHADEYAPALQQLPAQIGAERAAIDQQAIAGAGGNPGRHAELRQQLNTTSLQQKRAEYLQVAPVATGFYGALPFYKRYDSFASRLNDDGAFPIGTSAEEWGRRVWETYGASVDAAYRLHIAAQKFQALAADLPEMARQVDEAELAQPVVDLPRAIERRAGQIHQEQQICFDCLPNFLQHQVAQSTPTQENDTLTQRLSAYANATNALIAAKQAEVPAFSESNPNIVGPLSKPQVEALQHLADEQATRRAGMLWADYHRALALTESIRYLQQFSAAMANLSQRALVVEQLLARLEAERAAAEEAARQQAEAERIAAEEAARQQAEAERIAAEEAARRQADAARQSISYINDTLTAASATAFIPIGAATFAGELAPAAVRAAIIAAIGRLATPAVASTNPLLVAVLSAVWPSTLGYAERRYLISTPLSSLAPPGGPDLDTLALSSASIDLPYLLAGSEEESGIGLYVVPGGKPVAVRAATFDTERQVYSLALENPQRILTWTPASPPGGDEGSSTSLPPAPPGTIVYTGSSLRPVSNETEGYPALDLLDQERLIITFPIDSGLPPILVVFKSPRFEAGTSIGQGVQVTETWRAQAANREGAPIPAQIADLLRGVEFRNFDAFRRRFWKSVANDPELSKQFSERDLVRMRKNGNAPLVNDEDIYMSQMTFAIHHVLPISEGGGVYDLSNLRIVTPKVHNTIHYGEKP
ncbi:MULTISPECIES: S-type pyocin domain-containing protein [unclassified Pseudomonas]|uniref:S-type pyocin domain-containing protein n=1 Tax=unclassified Pseudomonas TaxID=196821 RepID=UPI000C1A7828|nr:MULTISPECIES: S-type pyocin domain-containing protein [unclassified Pseudomonas]MBS3186860.1 S-type pyocin domain-containing protein [Pseudomonas sp. PCH44]PIK75694.1 pyocin [Pseudomonas sp. 382]